MSRTYRALPVFRHCRRWDVGARVSAAEGQGRDEGDVRGDEVWSGVGLVRVLPVRRTEARGGQGTIRRDFP